MATSGGILRGSARAATGIVGVAIAAAVVAAALWLPLDSHTVTAPRSDVTPVPTDQQRVCPGPLLALAADSSKASAAASFGSPAIVAGSAAGADSPRITPLKSGGSATSAGAPQLLTLPTAVGATALSLVAGSQSQLAAQEDFAGLAVAACADASADSWLVGGATDLGQTSLVLLTNPSAVTATVDLTVYGEAGPVDAPGATGITVPAGAQKVVPLAGLAPSVAAPVVHVRTHGGRVLATMQQSLVNGIEPEGAELVGATNGPALTQRITGMMIRTLSSLQASQSTEGYGENLPAARVLVPGSSPAQISIGVIGEKGTAAGNTYTATLKPGVVTEIPLDDLTDGDYTLEVTSDQPVVVAARTSTESGAGKDFAWYPATPPLPEKFLAAVPAGPGVTLHLLNTRPTDAAITVTAPNGTSSSVTVPASAGTPVPLGSAGLYTVSGAAGLVASVGYSGDGALSSFAILPPAPLASSIRVYTR